MLKNISRFGLLFVIVLACYLRLHGITNGFPYIFHPDEPTIVRSALGIRFFPNPGHFDWPHLYIYANYAVYMGFAKLRDVLVALNLRPTVEGLLPIIWDDSLIYYLITRIFTALLGGLTVIPIYLTAKKLFGIKAALFSSLAFALIPFHIRHTHYSLPDGPMVFLLAWSVYFSSRILISDDSNNYIGAGAYAGFAASAKYNGGLVSLLVPFAHFARSIKNRERILKLKNLKDLLVAGIMAVVAFVIGTPYSVIDYKTFTRTDGPEGALWQFTNVGSVSLVERPLKFITEMLHRVSDDLAYSLLLIFFLVLVILVVKLVLKKSQPLDYYAWVFVLYGMSLLFYVSGFERPRSHYYMIAYPFIAIVFGYFCSWLIDTFAYRYKVPVFLLLVLLFSVPLYYASKESFTFGNSDTRNILDAWLNQNTNPSSKVLYTSADFSPVMKEHKLITHKGVDSNLVNSNTFIVLPLDSKDTSLLQSKYTLEPIYSISNEYRNGPSIQIYKIK